MVKTKQVLESDPEIQEMEERLTAMKQEKKNQLKAEKKQEKQQQRIDTAKQTILELEGEYERAKEVFFKVNGARRILKSAS